MDEKLEKALEFSNYMVTLNNQKRIIKEQLYENLIYYFNGGQFTIDQVLINFCRNLLDLGQTETILLDDNDTPIKIENLSDFTDEVLDVYWKAMNQYYNDYEKLRKNRSVKGLIEHND